MATTVNMIMQQKRGTLAQWTAKNPVLAAGEIGFVKDKNKIKIGDGVTAFNDLNYLSIEMTDATGLLDADGKIQTSLLPALAIGDTEVVATEDARLALTTAKVQKGDVVIVTGTNKTYRVIDDTKLNSEDGYAQILTPDAPVQSVNNKTGAVTLTTTDITEGDNQYFTEERAKAAAKTLNSTDLADGAKILHTDDEIIIDAGDIGVSTGE